MKRFLTLVLPVVFNMAKIISIIRTQKDDKMTKPSVKSIIQAVIDVVTAVGVALIAIFQ